MGAQILGVRSLWGLNFVRWPLIFLGPYYGMFFVSPFWCLEFWGGCYTFGTFVHAWCVRHHYLCTIHHIQSN